LPLVTRQSRDVSHASLSHLRVKQKAELPKSFTQTVPYSHTEVGCKSWSHVTFFVFKKCSKALL
jgi:hypothetical protein